MPVAQARLLIAADVVQLIASNSIKGDKGNVYSGALEAQIEKAWREDEETSAQALLKKMVVPEAACEVCAKGAVLTARVLRFNQCSVIEFEDNRESEDVKIPEFPQTMLAEMETLFECCRFDWNEEILSERKMSRLSDYIQDNNLKKMDSNSRLLHIMGLLIASGGKKIVL